MAAHRSSASPSSSLYRQSPYVFGLGCHNLIVPSSLPLANSSPSGLNCTACTGPWCPLPTCSSAPVEAEWRRTHSSELVPVTKVACEMGSSETEEGAYGSVCVRNGCRLSEPMDD